MVTSFLQLLARRYEGRSTTRPDQFIGFAVDGATRMRRLIEDLLAFSRCRDPRRALRPDRPRSESSRTSSPTCGPSIEEVGADVVVDELPVAEGDATQLRQVFLNLVGNALKFHNDHPPHVAIRVERDAEAWTISVEDDGIGIPPEHAERVFVIFQRLHARGGLPGHGHRARDLQEDRRTSWRTHPDRPDGRPGTTIRFTLPLPEGTSPMNIPMRPDRDPPRRGQPRRRRPDPGGAGRGQGRATPCNMPVTAYEAMRYLRREGDYADAPAPGPDPARPQPAAQGRARGAGRDEGRPRAAAHPGGRADHVVVPRRTSCGPTTCTRTAT